MSEVLQSTRAVGACKLSVMLKAYNHEPFIAQAIESVLAQQTSFPFEIVIGEDCSTDRTREIVMGFAARHPGRIRVLAHARNLGMTRNTMVLYGDCRGEYIAWLDGDDYWTSPDKLQRQVDFLDANPDHSVCFHDVLVVTPDGSASEHLWRGNRRGGGVEDMLFGLRGASSSCVFRKVLDSLPEWFEAMPFSDWPLHVVHAGKGKVGWVGGVHCVYRAAGASLAALGFDPEGEQTYGEFVSQHRRTILTALNRHFDFRYDDRIAAELLMLGHAGDPIRALTRPSIVRSALWRMLSARPAIARAALACAGALAKLVLHMHAVARRRASEQPSTSAVKAER
jgi:glycosyltransferase involved in cell wall biosynthesis